MRKQFVLDKRTNRLLEELAAYRAGNRSLVVREAIQFYSDMENRLDEIESDPQFQRMMAESDGDVRASRVISNEQVVKRAQAKHGKRRGR